MKPLKRHLESKKHVIWDWNGTLLDDVDMVVEAIAKVLREHDLEVPDRDRYTAIFGFPVSDYYLKLGFDFEKVPFEEVSAKFVDNYMEAIRGCRLHTGVLDLLADLKALGVSQSILSAAHEDSLKEHLAHFQIDGFFDRVYGLNDHHARSKVDRGKELLAECGLPLDQTVLVGDTDHDLEVGRSLGVEVILLGDGHQSYERLSQLHSHVIRDRHAEA